MESFESTANYLLENSMTNDTITLLYDEYKSEKRKQFLDFLNSALIIFRIVLGLITVTALVGNILTVAVILRNKGIKSNTDILTLTLAVTDILYIVFGVPVLILGYDMKNSLVGCGLIVYVTLACSFASVYVLVMIALDRYLALVYPIRAIRFRTKRNCYILLTVIWSVVLLGNMPILFEKPFCLGVKKVKMSNMRILLICSFVFEFILPLFFMCILYGHIIISFYNAKILGVNTTTIRVRLIANRRVIKMVIIAIIVFVICRLPFHITLLYGTFVSNVEQIVVFVPLSIVVSCMLYLNCIINPILYSFHSRTFRNGCRDVLICKT